MMLPILISVSVAPGSYLPFANVALVAAAITRAAERAPHRQSNAGMVFSLVGECVSSSFWERPLELLFCSEAFFDASNLVGRVPRHSARHCIPIARCWQTESLPREDRRGRSLV